MGGVDSGEVGHDIHVALWKLGHSQHAKGEFSVVAAQEAAAGCDKSQAAWGGGGGGMKMFNSHVTIRTIVECWKCNHTTTPLLCMPQSCLLGWIVSIGEPGLCPKR